MEDITRVVSEEAIENLLARADEGHAPTLLLATDGSPPARRAAAYAVGLAHRSDGIVVAIHVIDGGAVPDESAARGNTLGTMVEAGNRAIEDAKAIAGEWYVRCDTVLADGTPAWTIAKVAEKVEADCVVLGASSGRGGSEATELAERVVENCSTPAFVVGGDKSPRGLGQDRGQE